MIFAGGVGTNPLWCPRHWGLLNEEDRGGIGLPLSVALLMRIVQDSAFMDACGRDERKLETADPSRIQTMITKPPFCPVCCYLGDEVFQQLIDEVRAGKGPELLTVQERMDQLQADARGRLHLADASESASGDA